MIKKTVKIFLRTIIFPIIYILKLYRLFNLSNKTNCIIVNYHGVIENANFKYNGRHFPKNVFEKHLRYFKKNFNVVPLSEIFEMYRKNTIPTRKTIAITFDDGFENNYTVAYPLLKKYNIPATFFVSGVCAENNNSVLWSEVINILRYFQEKVMIDNKIFSKHDNYSYLNIESNLTLSGYIKKCNAQERDRIIDDIKNRYNFNQILEKVEPDIWTLMKKEQIKELADSGLIEIASHGYLHYNLANLTYEEALFDLKKSKEILEKLTNKEVVSVAFPDSSYNQKVKDICLSLGYKNFCAVTYQCDGDDMDENILPRFGMSATTNYYSNIIFLHKAFNKTGF